MKKIYILILCSIVAASLHAQEGFGTYLRDIIQKQEKGILVAAKLIEACGLCDSLDIIMDYEYENRYMRGEIPEVITYYAFGDDRFYAPQHRYYGYTLFAETDEFWESELGKDYKTITAADVASYIQQFGLFDEANESTDFSDPSSTLYQFVTYHLLNRRLTPNHLVNHINEYGYTISDPNRLSVPVTEYYVTMGKRRVLKLYESAESDGVYINRFPYLDNSRLGTYKEVHCDPEKEGIRIDTKNTTQIINAIIYPIGKLLAYDQKTTMNMGNTRLRMDVASIFPEMASNDIRLSTLSDERHKNVYLPCDIYPYLDDVTIINDNTKFCYWTGWGNGWANMQGDEFAILGMQDITLRLPPVPKSGTYELRLATQSGNPNRSTIQIYFGTDKNKLSPLGMPIDMRQGANYIRTTFGNIQSFIGYQADTNDEYIDQMSDNELHENGFMKGCKQYSNYSSTMRDRQECLRRVIGKMTMEPNQTYYLRLKNVTDNPSTQLYLDYLEFCPESVYDNPEKPEDIW